MLAGCGGDGGDNSNNGGDTAPGLGLSWASEQLLYATTNNEWLYLRPDSLLADGMGGAWMCAGVVNPALGLSPEQAQAPALRGLWLQRVDLATGQWSDPRIFSTSAPPIQGTDGSARGQLAALGQGAMLMVGRTAWSPDYFSYIYSTATGEWTETSLGQLSSSHTVFLRSGPNGDTILIGYATPGDGWSRRFDVANQSWKATQTFGVDSVVDVSGVPPGWPVDLRRRLTCATVDAQGRALFLMQIGGADKPLTVWSNAVDTDAWVSTPLPLSQPSGRTVPNGCADLAVDSAGNVLVVWLEDDGSGVGHLVEARLAAGSTAWSTQVVQQLPVPVLDDALGQYATAWFKLAMDAAGNAWLYGKTDNALYRRPAATGTWQRLPLAPGLAPEGAQVEQLVLDRQGNATLAGLWPAALSTATTVPSVWWNRYDAELDQWNGPAQYSVGADEAGNAGQAVYPRMAASPEGPVAMALGNVSQHPGNYWVLYSIGATRVWGSVLR
ncbi:MAG: hypothetical protein KDF56_03675 [Ottowia sp.]|nr:hypothetical protein [Ottowia sp.]